MLIIATYVLPIALAIVMLSLGLSLTVADFLRVMRFPLPVCVALLCQTVLLPLVCLGLVTAFRLPPELAVGMMLLAASPGGTVANILSHLADGDVALNITLMAVNSVLSVVTLPLILALSMAHFMGEDRVIPPQFSKIVQVFAAVLVPVAIGMLLRWRYTRFADRLHKPVKIIAGVVLVLVATVAIVSVWPTMSKYFVALGATVILFNLISLLVGYYVPRAVRVNHRQSIAIGMEIGMHNGALAISIALSPLMLNSPVMSAAPSLYGVLSLIISSIFVFVMSRRRRPAA